MISDNSITCPQCGRVLDNNYIFCPQCGCDLTEGMYNDYDEEDDDLGWEWDDD